MNMIVNLAGWLGSVLLVIAYWKNSRGEWNAENRLYQLLNVFGSLLLIVNTVYYGAYPSSAVNVVWVCIGVRFLFKSFRHETKCE